MNISRCRIIVLHYVLVGRRSVWAKHPQIWNVLFFFIALVSVMSCMAVFLTVDISYRSFLQRRFDLVFLASIIFVPIAYSCIFMSHSATPNEMNTVVGFVDDDGRIDGTAGSPLSPPRVTYSKFSITMSYLKINLYLTALAVVIDFGNLLVKGVGLSPAFYPYLAVVLYCGGFFFYTYRVFNYRTNILLAFAMVFTIFSLPNPGLEIFGYMYILMAVESISHCFLLDGGESTGEETSHSAGAAVVFTTVTGTGSDLEAPDVSKGGGISVGATPVK
jgi:hypothetical protein